LCLKENNEECKPVTEESSPEKEEPAIAFAIGSSAQEIDTPKSPYDEVIENKSKDTTKVESKDSDVNEDSVLKQRRTEESEIESLHLCQEWCADDGRERGTNAEYPDDEVCDGVCACFDTEPENKSKTYNNEISDENSSGVACDGWNFLQSSNEKEKLEYKTADDENTETGIFCSWF